MYKFKYIPDEENRYDITEVEHSIQGVTAPEVCDAFYHFMRGCGFHNESIISSLEELIYQNSPEDKAAKDYDESVSNSFDDEEDDELTYSCFHDSSVGTEEFLTEEESEALLKDLISDAERDEFED